MALTLGYERFIRYSTDASGNVTGMVDPTSGSTIKSGKAKATKIAMLGNSITRVQAVPNSSGISTWAASTAKSLTNTVVPNHMIIVGFWPHLYYTCTTAGTTGSVEPFWPDVVGETVTDGTVVWTATALRTDAPSYGMGYWTLAQQLSGQRLEEVYIAGLSGAQSSTIVNYVDNALACSPDVVYFQAMFENDCWPGVAPTLSTVLANWNLVEAAMNRVRGLGKTVMLQTVLPNGSTDGSAAFTGYSSGNGTKAWNWLNTKIREYALNNPDVLFFDAAGVYVDANPANPVWPENTATYLSLSGSGQELKKTDGVHPYIAADYALALALATFLEANFQQVDRFTYANDAYSISKNPLNYGTSGTAGAGITSGTPANSMGMDAYGTVTTAALSKVSRTDRAGEWQQSTYIATAGDNLSYGPLAANNTGSPFAVGDVVQGLAEVKIVANPTLLRQVYHWIQFTSGTFTNAYSALLSGNAAQDIGQFITVDTVFTLKTPPFKVPTSATNTITYTRCAARGAANFTAQFGRIATLPVNPPDIS